MQIAVPNKKKQFNCVAKLRIDDYSCCGIIFCVRKSCGKMRYNLSSPRQGCLVIDVRKNTSAIAPQNWGKRKLQKIMEQTKQVKC